MPGMMPHIDASKHDWFGDGPKYELIVMLYDATSGIYYPQLVEAESTRSILGARCEVVRTRGVFCSLYSDRAAHFFSFMDETEFGREVSTAHDDAGGVPFLVRSNRRICSKCHSLAVGGTGFAIHLKTYRDHWISLKMSRWITIDGAVFASSSGTPTIWNGLRALDTPWQKGNPH
jgi:hypothetical protein